VKNDRTNLQSQDGAGGGEVWHRPFAAGEDRNTETNISTTGGGGLVAPALRGR